MLGPFPFSCLSTNDFRVIVLNSFEFHRFYAKHSLSRMEVVVDNDSLKQDSSFLMVKKLSSKSRKDKLHYFSTSSPPPPSPALLHANLSHSQIVYYLFLRKGDKTLGLYVDSPFSWKFYIFHISRRIKRFIGLT